jgi:Mor family transcriptional regulator
MTIAHLPTMRSLSIKKRNKKIVAEYQKSMKNGKPSLETIGKLAKKNKLRQRQIYIILNKSNTNSNHNQL